MLKGEARTPTGRYVGADAFGAQDLSTLSSYGDESLQRCCGVYSASEHGTWPSSREATEHPSLHGAEDFCEKIRLRDGVKTGVVRALIRPSVRPPTTSPQPRQRHAAVPPAGAVAVAFAFFFSLSRGHRSFRAFGSFSFIFSSIHHKAFAIIILQLARFCRGKKNRASRRLRHGHS